MPGVTAEVLPTNSIIGATGHSHGTLKACGIIISATIQSLFSGQPRPTWFYFIAYSGRQGSRSSSSLQIAPFHLGPSACCPECFSKSRRSRHPLSLPTFATLLRIASNNHQEYRTAASAGLWICRWSSHPPALQNLLLVVGSCFISWRLRGDRTASPT